MSINSRCIFLGSLILGLVISTGANAGGGYFMLGNGPVAWQTAGAVTAVAEDAFAGASNPAKLTAAGNRMDMSLVLLNPNRKVKRTGASGSDEIYNFSSRSANSLFLVPEFAYSRQVSDTLAIGLASYANGGLNIELHDTTGVPGTNSNPDTCGTRPGNFLLGCGELGFDLSQFIVAPTVAWTFAPGHSIGISPLLTLQAFKAFGLQAFAPGSRYPNHVSNNGYDYAFGMGVRVGWYGEIRPWLSLGAAYASKTYMQDFDKYKGLFAEGSFDVPANYSIGAAFKPWDKWLVALDVQRIEFREVRALGNSIRASLLDPVANPLGSKTGSGFGWQRNQTNYKLGLTYRATSRLTVRAGYTYGKRANNNDLDAISFGVLASNPIRAASMGFTWKAAKGDEFHMSYAHISGENYNGPSALFPGAKESVQPYINALNVAWSRKL
ncbi:MAG: outer membrane protein transport protein [Porticoccaceae bacterium]